MCNRKDHPLVEIMRDGYDDGYQRVVRWCPDCGAIVVDGEMDGRVMPGREKPMKFPASAQPK